MQPTAADSAASFEESPAQHVEVAVLGAGVIGLAVARELARRGREVLVLEAERVIGHHTSSRNSEVIHAGIYYPTHSLKAQLCVVGKRALYAYCTEHAVAHRRLGKLIVATRDEDQSALLALREQGLRNGVEDLELLTSAQVSALEPSVRAVAGLWSPSTGILDSHGLMAALKRDLEAERGLVVLGARVLGGAVRGDGIELWVAGVEARPRARERRAERTRLICDCVINAAGLWAPQVARSIEGIPPASIPTAHYAKGHYFMLRGKSPFTHLVYPVPVPGGLGTHVTLDLAGQARFGPDVSWVDQVDYSFEEGRADAFYASIRRWFPGLAEDALAPGYTGIRPKLGPAGSPAADFVIQAADQHGVAGLVNLYGIESPGLTAALAIATSVAERLGSR